MRGNLDDLGMGSLVWKMKNRDPIKMTGNKKPNFKVLICIKMFSRIDQCYVEVLENRIRQENVWRDRDRQLETGTSRENRNKRNQRRKEFPQQSHKKWRKDELTDEVAFNYIETFRT